MNNFRVEAATIAVGLVVMGAFIRCGLGTVADNQRVVSVKGLSEKEVKADKVTWPITVKLAGNNLTEIYDEVNSSNTKITQFLTSQGIPSQEISVNAPTIQDKAAEMYGSQEYTYRYSVTDVVTVSTTKVDLVRSLMSRQGELLKQGVAISGSNYETPVVYQYTGLNDIKPQMIEEATKKAREAAEKFAKDSESKLGKIKSANQGQITIEDRDQNTPFVKRVRVVSSITYYLN